MNRLANSKIVNSVSKKPKLHFQLIDRFAGAPGGLEIAANVTFEIITSQIKPSKEIKSIYKTIVSTNSWIAGLTGPTLGPSGKVINAVFTISAIETA